MCHGKFTLNFVLTEILKRFQPREPAGQTTTALCLEKPRSTPVILTDKSTDSPLVGKQYPWPTFALLRNINPKFNSYYIPTN